MTIRINEGLRNAIGNAVATALNDGVIELRTGTQPATPNSSETGSLIARITVNGGAFTPGSSTNGLSFETAADGIVPKNAGEVWSGTVLIDGTVGHFRWYSNAYTTGSSEAAVRFDGSVSTSGADMNLVQTTFTSGQTITLDIANINILAS